MISLKLYHAQILHLQISKMFVYHLYIGDSGCEILEDFTGYNSDGNHVLIKGCRLEFLLLSGAFQPRYYPLLFLLPFSFY